MRFDTVLAIHTLMAAGFGLSLLLAPALTATVYGMTPEPSLLYLGRLLGSAFLAFACITWLMRGCTHPQAVRAVALGFTVGSIAGLIASVHAVTSGATNAVTWSTVAIYAFLVVGYGPHAFAKGGFAASGAHG